MPQPNQPQTKINGGNPIPTTSNSQTLPPAPTNNQDLLVNLGNVNLNLTGPTATSDLFTLLTTIFGNTAGNLATYASITIEVGTTNFVFLGNGAFSFSTPVGGAAAGALPTLNAILGAGNLTVFGGANPIVITAGGTGQELVGGSGGSTIYGGTGDSLYGGTGTNVIFGGQSDTIWSGQGSSTVYGAAGDTIQGIGPGVIYGGPGDSIVGGTSETIFGSAGNTIVGGAGGDFIHAEAGGEVVVGEAGPIVVFGGPGDTIFGGLSPNALIFGGPNESIFGATGTTVIQGGPNDYIQALSGATTIQGAVGDTILAGSGSDVIGGSAGDMFIAGEAGPVTVFGGVNDTIATGASTNVINLAEQPEFVWEFNKTGSATVTGWTAGDKIVFAGENASTIASVVAGAKVVNGNTVLTLADGSTMTLVGITNVTANFFGTIG